MEEDLGHPPPLPVMIPGRSRFFSVAQNMLGLWPTKLTPCSQTYRMCSIRCHGYYLFHCTILCDFYSGVATNWERRLLNSSVLGKIFRNCKGFEKNQFHKINEDELWCSLISRCFATKRYLHGTSNPFPRFFFNDFTRWLPSMPQKMPNFSGQRAFLYLSCKLIWYCHSSSRFVHVHMCYLNISCG